MGIANLRNLVLQYIHQHKENIMWKYSESNMGEFVEQEYGKTFTYKEVSEYNPYGVTHEIDVLDGARFANVKKTVAYVVVDEDENGNPVFEKCILSSI